MNLVDEADLLALMEEEDADAYTAEKEADRKSTRLNSSHSRKSRMPSSA